MEGGSTRKSLLLRLADIQGNAFSVGLGMLSSFICLLKPPQNKMKIEKRKWMQTKLLLKRLARRRVLLTVIGNSFKLHCRHSVFI